MTPISTLPRASPTPWILDSAAAAAESEKSYRDMGRMAPVHDKESKTNEGENMATLAQQIEKAEQAEQAAAARLRDLRARQRAHQRKQKAAMERALGARVAAAAMESEERFWEVAAAIYAEHAEARAAAAGAEKRDTEVVDERPTESGDGDMEAAQETLDVSHQEDDPDDGYHG